MTDKNDYSERLPAPQPQRVRWGPPDGRAPGIVVDDLVDHGFVPWPELQVEIERNLLPQVRAVPMGASAELGDLGDRKNWLIRIMVDGREIGNIWFGSDPDNKWKWDGLIRLGDAHTSPPGQSPVWQTFERYSDGSYRRVEAKRIV